MAGVKGDGARVCTRRGRAEYLRWYLCSSEANTRERSGSVKGKKKMQSKPLSVLKGATKKNRFVKQRQEVPRLNAPHHYFQDSCVVVDALLFFLVKGDVVIVLWYFVLW